MAAANFEPLISQAITSSTTTLGHAVAIPNTAIELIATSTVAGRTDGTFTTTIQHSPDGVNWFTLDATAAQSANGMVIKAVTVNCFHLVRASVLSATVTTGATSVEVRLYFSYRT